MSGNPEPIPEEDSEDLSDDEIAGSLGSGCVGDIIGSLREARCLTCSDPLHLVEHALRRRQPHLYWRVLMRCGDGHENEVTFKADWIRGGST